MTKTCLFGLFLRIIGYVKIWVSLEFFANETQLVEINN